MGKRCNGLGEDRHWVFDQIGKGEVVNSEDDDGMEVGIKASDVGRQDRDGLGDRCEFSRPCLSGFCHTGLRIILVSQRLDCPVASFWT